MYSYIKGELAEVNTDHIVIDVHGIGYTIYIPANCFAYLPSVGQTCKIHTYLHIREDIMMLYGFLTKDDLTLFKQLITSSTTGSGASPSTSAPRMASTGSPSRARPTCRVWHATRMAKWSIGSSMSA